MSCSLTIDYVSNYSPPGVNSASFDVPDGSYSSGYVYWHDSSPRKYDVRTDGDAGTIVLAGPYDPPPDFTIEYVGFTNTCPIPTYDSINGTCTPSSTHGTAGFYPSLSACKTDPNNLPCPPCPACPACPPCPPCPTDPEEVQFTSISVPVFARCNASGFPENDPEIVSVIAGTEAAELLKFFQLAEIQGNATCNQDAAACCDGWRIRPEYHRPQVIYQFAEIDNSGKIVGAPMYKITVPHHIADKPDAPLPNYHRGNWETIFVLKDNSKVTIHSLNEANGTTMLNAIKLRIAPAYLVGSYLSKSSLVVTDNQIAQINVKNRMAKYFSTGAKNELPDWIAKW